jgi:hypothetical protein
MAARCVPLGAAWGACGAAAFPRGRRPAGSPPADDPGEEQPAGMVTGRGTSPGTCPWCRNNLVESPPLLARVICELRRTSS